MPRRDPPLIVPIVDWRQVMARACTSKIAYVSRGDAAHARRDLVHRVHDERVRYYPCPFAAGDGSDVHWHLGHPPDVAGMRRIAAALRARANDPAA